MSYSKAPSDMVQVHLAFAPDAVAAAADVDLSTSIDMSEFEYLLVIATMGDGDTAVSIQLQESDLAASGFTSITNQTSLISLAATDDNTSECLEIRTHGLKQYLSMNVTGTGGVTSDVSIHVIGFGPQYSDSLPAITDSVAEIGLA